MACEAASQGQSPRRILPVSVKWFYQRRSAERSGELGANPDPLLINPVVELRRASALTEAQRIGLQGSVQNLSDGSVEVIAGGTRAQVEEMTAWCRRGPPLASVSDVVEVEPLHPCHEELPPFQIKRSGRSDMNDRPVRFRLLATSRTTSRWRRM